MIFTSYFAKIKKIPKNITRISVALYQPQNISNIIKFPLLAPTEEIFRKWKNRDKIPYSEKEYEVDYRRDVLSKLDPYDIEKELMGYATDYDVVLLCYEKEFCHRHIIAKWFEENGIECKEYKPMDETVITNLNVLECSSKGDKRFSSFYAYVNAFGKGGTIEHHYQSCKRFNEPEIKNPKGQEPDWIEIMGIRLDKKYLSPYFKLLWVKYLDKNPDLVEYASKFEDFHDIFKGHNTVNCQADVIRQYVKEGRESILSEPLVEEFLNIIKGLKKDIYYTGIGSRETPDDILSYFEYLGYLFAKKGFILRSGHAKGSDQAFENGCDKAKGRKEIYLPWKNFEGSSSPLYTISDEAMRLAELYHPSWDSVSRGGKLLLARDSYQILGYDLKTPSTFVVCWTKDGKGAGGTGQAIRIANAYNIPIFDLGNTNNVQDKLMNFLNNIG